MLEKENMYVYIPAATKFRKQISLKNNAPYPVLVYVRHARMVVSIYAENKLHYHRIELNQLLRSMLLYVGLCDWSKQTRLNSISHILSRHHNEIDIQKEYIMYVTCYTVGSYYIFTLIHIDSCSLRTNYLYNRTVYHYLVYI